MGWFDDNAPAPSAPGGPSPTGDQSEAGKTPEQQYWDAVHGLGWDPSKGNTYRGKQQDLVDWLTAHGAPGWEGGGTKADDWLKDPTGGEWDAITSGGQLVFNKDDTNTGGPGSAGGANAYLNDPSYQFTFDQALQGAQRSAAAKGTLMTGGFQKALANYLGGVASQGYDAQFRRLFGVSQLGADMAARQAAANQSYANAANEAQTGKGNAAAQGSTNQGNIWGDTASNIGNAAAQYRLFRPPAQGNYPAGSYPSTPNTDYPGGYPQPEYQP